MSEAKTADDGEPVAWCSCGESFTNAGAAGSHVSNSTGEHELVEEPPENMSDDETTSDDSGQSIGGTTGTVGWIGGLDYIVRTGDGLFKVNAAGDEPTVTPLDVDDAAATVLATLADSQPSQPDIDAISARTVMDMHRDVHNLVQTTQQMVSSGGTVAQSGGSGDSGGSGGGGGGDDEEQITNTISVQHDYDLEALATGLEIWFDNYADMVDGDLIADAIHVEQAQATIPGGYDHPQAGQTVVGFEVDHAPWYWGEGPWDQSNNKWGTDDGNAPDGWSESGAAFRELVKSKDEFVGFNMADDDADYPDYTNFIPASDAEELTN